MDKGGHLNWGELTDINIRLQFAFSKFDRLSFATSPIDIWSGEQQLGHASGFFWRGREGIWLITNWHCVTGNNPFTCTALNPGRPPPTKVTFYPLVLRTFDNGTKHIPTRVPTETNLFEDHSPVWRQHADFERKRTDIVAIQLGSLKEKGDTVCINDYAEVELHHHVGADLFVVGYPLNNYVGWMPPFWKRGSFAGEPLLPFADKPLFPIDVLSTEGMSGSPVFRRVFGPRASPDASTTQLDNIVATQFVGVYAGRLLNKELDRVGIGYSWYGYLVNEIVSSGIKGTTC